MLNKEERKQVLRVIDECCTYGFLPARVDLNTWELLPCSNWKRYLAFFLYVVNSIYNTQQTSQWSQNIIETGHLQDQLNTRHTINVIVNNKKESQKRYREQNREKLKQREAERRKLRQRSKSKAGPSTSLNTNVLEVNNDEIITVLQKKREYQRRYRERNRDKLKQREAERRRCLQNAKMITKLSTPPNIE